VNCHNTRRPFSPWRLLSSWAICPWADLRRDLLRDLIPENKTNIPMIERFLLLAMQGPEPHLLDLERIGHHPMMLGRLHALEPCSRDRFERVRLLLLLGNMILLLPPKLIVKN